VKRRDFIHPPRRRSAVACPLEAIRNGSDDMRAQQINRFSGKVLIVLSLIALLAVLSGYTQPPQPDEGTAAHIFQLSVVALVPTIVLFLATADWRQPLRSAARPLAD
jgi:Na+/H+ antiporter NhaD/arsenite permease-like protein